MISNFSGLTVPEGQKEGKKGEWWESKIQLYCNCYCSLKIQRSGGKLKCLEENTAKLSIKFVCGLHGEQTGGPL